MTDPTDQTYYGDFERDGEDVVRRNLAASLYMERKAKLARHWLQIKEREREEFKNSEQIELAARAASAAERAADTADKAAATAERALTEARRAADAAESQATTAQTASRIAMGALIIAIIAAILTIMQMVK